ncbi:MAG TPA: S41 family peptidase [Polyangiaceae bacterium]|nr:S41 family peptidase [Polyangiaceae bacterium]
MRRTRSMPLFAFALGLACAPGLGGCGGDSPATDASGSEEIRELTVREALADFDQMVEAIRATYGPLRRKEARYGFTLDAIAEAGREKIRAGTTDADFVRAYQEFLANFRDGHVSLSTPLASDSSRGARVPLIATPFEDKFLVSLTFGPLASAGIALGDELVRVDGRPVAELAAELGRFENVPNPKSLAHFAALRLTFRPFFLPEGLRPEPGTEARLGLRRADGSEYEVAAPWLEDALPRRSPNAPAPTLSGRLADARAEASSNLAGLIKAELARFGEEAPFFLTEQVARDFRVQPVRPSAATAARFGAVSCGDVDGAPSFDCYAFSGIYEFEGKKLLLVRIPSYAQPDPPGPGAFTAEYFRAVLAEFEPQVDALVVDETHNPGGSVALAGQVLSTLVRREGPGFVFAHHADRKWMNDYLGFLDFITTDPSVPDEARGELAAVLQDRFTAIESAFDQGADLSPPFGIALDPDLITPDPDYHWQKPFVMLADELSGSAGDIVPMVVKANRAGVVFGETTMGLGGNVESVMTTSNSLSELNLTRSLFTVFKPDGNYVEEDFVEDLGVVPDVAYSHTAADFRAGYVNYVTTFSREALKLLAPPTYATETSLAHQVKPN